MVTTKGVGRVQAPGKFSFTFEDISCNFYNHFISFSGRFFLNKCKFLQIFPVSPRDAPYWVVETDYTNYSVVWSCSERARMNARKTIASSFTINYVIDS